MIRLDNLQTTDPLGNETTYSYDYLQIDNRSVTRKIGYIGHLRADFRLAEFKSKTESRELKNTRGMAFHIATSDLGTEYGTAA